MLIGVPFLFLLLHLIDSRGGEGVEVAEEDIWTKEEVEKVNNHINEEEGDEGTGRTEGGSAGDNEEGSEKGDEGEGGDVEGEGGDVEDQGGDVEDQGGDEGSEHDEHEEQEGDGDSEVFGYNQVD